MKLTKKQSAKQRELLAIAQQKIDNKKKYSVSLLKDVIAGLILSFEEKDFVKYQVNTGRNDRIAALKELCQIGVAKEVDIKATTYADYYPDEEVWALFELCELTAAKS